MGANDQLLQSQVSQVFSMKGREQSSRIITKMMRKSYNMHDAEEVFGGVEEGKAQPDTDMSDKNAAKMVSVYVSMEDSSNDEDQLEKAMVKDMLLSSYQLKFSADRSATRSKT